MASLTFSWLICGIIVILTAFVATYLYMTRNFNYWKKKGVVEKQPVPFFGNFFPCISFRKSGNELFKDLYAKYIGESVVGFHLFDKPCLLVRDIDLINRITVKDFNVFTNKYASSDDHDILGSANLFMIKTPHWKTLRSKLSPVFTSGKLKNMFQLMVDVGKDLDSHLESLNLEGDGRVIELEDICGKYTTDVIATSAYGLRANSLNNPEAGFRKYGKKIFDFTYKRAVEFGAIFFAPGIVKLFGLMFFEKSCSNFLRKALWNTLTQRMESGFRRNDLIDTLIDLKKGQPQAEIDDPNSFKFDGDNLTAQAAIYFTGGYKTTSVTLFFTLHELALNSDIQSKLRDEITSALEENKGVLSYEWIMKLPYLDMVISETLRKYYVVGYVDRVAATDYKVPDSDLVIEKGTPVFILIAGIHHDPNYFPDPERYDPVRFTFENKQARSSRIYMPFGDGPRNCVGLRFALASAKLAMVKIIGKYKVTPCEKTVIPLRPNPRSFFSEMDHGLFLKVQKIKNAAL